MSAVADRRRPGRVDNLWAPEIFFDPTAPTATTSTTRLRRSAGTRRRSSALATNTTLDPADDDYELGRPRPGLGVEPRRPVTTRSTRRSSRPAASTTFMAYGSWWQGIYMLELDWPSGKVARAAPPRRTDCRPAAGRPTPSRRPRWWRTAAGSTCSPRGTRAARAAETSTRSGSGARRRHRPVRRPDGSGCARGRRQVLATSGNLVGPGGQSVSAGVHRLPLLRRGRRGETFRLEVASSWRGTTRAGRWRRPQRSRRSSSGRSST